MLIDVDKDENTPKLYDVSAMPTLVIADAEGNELAKSVGAPFSEPEGAISWFDEIGGKITAYAELNAKWNESKHTDTASGEKLAEAAMGLGKAAQAVEIYEALATAAGEDKARAAGLYVKLTKLYLDQWEIEKAGEYLAKAEELAPADSDVRIDVDVAKAKVLLYTEKPEEARKLAQTLYDKLLEKADARAIDLADVIMNTESDREASKKAGRAMYQKLAKTFEKHERVWELKVYAAWYGIRGEEHEACLKELAEVAEKGEGQWKGIAKSVIDGLKEEEEKEKEEGGNG